MTWIAPCILSQTQYATSASVLMPGCMSLCAAPLFVCCFFSQNGLHLRASHVPIPQPSGEVRLCQDLFQVMRPNIDQRRVTMLYNTVLKAFSNAGDDAGAESWYASMVEQCIRTNAKTFGKLANSAARRGKDIVAERCQPSGIACP